MESKICMNASCKTTTTNEWKRGWALRSGGYADLCYNCGSAYESLVFCDTFHSEESGWRKCFLCGQRLHCGCIASKSLLELLDYGGVGCKSCARGSRLHSIDQIPNGFGALTVNNNGDLQTPIRNRVTGDNVNEGGLSQLCRIMEAKEPNFLPQSQRGDMSIKPMVDRIDTHESLAQPSLSMTLGAPSGTSTFVPPFSGSAVDGREQSKAPSPFQQGQRSRPILPKPSKPGLGNNSETNKGMITQPRIARPPVEGRGKSQLLPRYWPRITDQELQQISGDLNSTVVPLFEKVLSASDAGRIGRLVLPKACAEAYFPPIHQSEGLPLRIQDVKGNEWTFQFRFWPNNNSRMYVLEGVTPCIQSMQLRAGDTVIFSRIDPGGKLVMGFRKAANSEDAQDAQTSALSNGAPQFSNGAHAGETSFPGVTEKPSVSSYAGIFQTMKGSNDPHINVLSDNLNLADGSIGWRKTDNHGGRTNGDLVQQSVVSNEKKKTRNIGNKSKRLLMNSEEALELRLTWEEAQDLLRPSPSAKPSIVTIEDHEFEEYDEPPVFGKKTVFITRPSGGQEQWAQCDDCSKWRSLPMDVLLPPKWTCSDNVWDSSRCSCSVPEEMSPKELENLLRVGRDFKKRKTVESHRSVQEHEPSGLDALASAAVLGDIGDSGEPSTGVTTKHPRHRAGCTCIVCIQPPSGKGKHKPTCTCNVCMTVKRRFKTLMLRKKKRQERVAEMFRKDKNGHKDEPETNGTSVHASLHMSQHRNEGNPSKMQAEVAETSAGQIDLNCDPNREDMQLEGPGMSIMSLVEAASLPLETYVKQNRLGSLMSEQQASLASSITPETNGENDGHLPDEEFLASVGWERESRGDGDSNLD